MFRGIVLNSGLNLNAVDGSSFVQEAEPKIQLLILVGKGDRKEEEQQTGLGFELEFALGVIDLAFDMAGAALLEVVKFEVQLVELTFPDPPDSVGELELPTIGIAVEDSEIRDVVVVVDVVDVEVVAVVVAVKFEPFGAGIGKEPCLEGVLCQVECDHRCVP